MHSKLIMPSHIVMKDGLACGDRVILLYDFEDDFMNFYNWSMENGYRDDLTIDRINVNGNYEPNNCRWVDYKSQARNR